MTKNKPVNTCGLFTTLGEAERGENPISNGKHDLEV